VILPEIGHHFLELPLAGNSAGDARRLKLRYDLSSEIEPLLELLAERDAVRLTHYASRVRSRPTHLLSRTLLVRVLCEEIVLILVERGIIADERRHRVVVDFIRLELLIDPLVETDRAYLEDVAWFRAECEAIQRLDYLLVGGELANIGARYNGFRRILRTGFLRGDANWRDADERRRNDSDQFCDTHCPPHRVL
jgi:hypothetical protein